MANEALAWPSAPALTDANDGTQAYNMGVEFTVSTTQSCTGVRWRVPDTVATPPGGTHAVAIWDSTNNVRKAYKEFVPVPGGDQDILFDAAASLPSTAGYVASVYTIHYVFRSADPTGVNTPSGSATAGKGRLRTDNGGAAGSLIPDQQFSSIYYVSPLISTGSTTPFTKDISETYRILNAWTKNTAETYRVLNAWVRNTVEAYRILNAWQLDKTELYTILGLTGFVKDQVESYRILNAFTVDRAEAYRILRSWVLDRPESFRVFNAWVKQFIERYTVGNPAPVIVRPNVTAYLNQSTLVNLAPPIARADLDEVN